VPEGQKAQAEGTALSRRETATSVWRRWAARRALGLTTAFICALSLAPAGALDQAQAAGPPIVEASWVTDVTATSANLRARVNPNGLSATYRFEYATLAAWEANGFAGASVVPPSGAGALGAGEESIPIARQITPLTPTTTYRYRLRVTNGTVVFGPERTLTTEVPSNVFTLPDGRAWELVSPVDKDGGAIAAPESLFGGGVFQASGDGHAVTYSSASSFAGGAGAPGANQYLSTRSPGGWSTQNVTAPSVSGSYGDDPDGVPYRLFSADLAVGLLSNGVRCRSVGNQCPVGNPPLAGSGAPAGYRNYYLRGASGDFAALLDSIDLGELVLGPDEFELAFLAATPDLAHLVLSSCAKLTADATEIPAPGGCNEGEQNLYAWAGGELSLVNLLPGDLTGTPGAVPAAPAGAVSKDRIYFQTLEDSPLYLREEGRPTKLVPETEGGGASFQAASTDGAVAFFLKGGALFRYDAEAGTSVAIAAGVKGVLAVSGDGAYVYYQDAAGLQQWHNGTTTQIAAGADATLPVDYPPATGTSRLAAAGVHLAFLSEAELTGYDNTDANAGTPDTELYLYRESAGGGAGTLLCASCNPTGERPEGSASIPGAPANGSIQAYRPRALAASGDRLFFDSADRLAATDTDSAPDVYQWEAAGTGDCARAPACISLISEGREGGASFIDASISGDDVFFLTAESSVGADPGSIDLYDARVGGGLPEPAEPFICLGDACQALPSPPDDPTPGTLVPNAGNPPLHLVKPKPHKKRRHHRKKRKHHHHKPKRHLRGAGR
jgi:hypothetical protein